MFPPKETTIVFGKEFIAVADKDEESVDKVKLETAFKDPSIVEVREAALT